MNALINIVGWLVIGAAATGLAWLYGSSWRAVAKALDVLQADIDHPPTISTPPMPLSTAASTASTLRRGAARRWPAVADQRPLQRGRLSLVIRARRVGAAARDQPVDPLQALL